MLKRIALALLVCSAVITPSFAQGAFNSTAAQGNAWNGTNNTGEGPQGTGALSTWSTGPQSTVRLPTGFGQLAGPPQKCVLTSIVKDSGYNDFVFGDEGTEGPPPYFDFAPLSVAIGSGGGSGSGGSAAQPLTALWSLGSPSTFAIGPAANAAQFANQFVAPAAAAAAQAVGTSGF